MIEHFRLGFSNRTLGYRLPEANRKEGAEIRGRLQRLGILRESGHEHFTGSVVIPVIDLEGNVTEIYGRKITEGLRPGTPLHMYLPGPHKGVWNEEALMVSKEIILCESLIDALYLLVRRLPERDGQLRRERLHRRSPPGVQETRHEESADRLRPGRSRRESGCRACRQS